MGNTTGCRRQIHLDFHTPEFPTDCFTDFNPERTAKLFAQSGVEVVKVFAKDHYGNSFYNTRVGHKHKRLKVDYLAEMTRALHKQKIKVMAYFSVCFDEHVGTAHPEWLQRGIDTGTASCKIWDYLCLNSPYQKRVLLPAFEEVVSEYDIDGLWLDIVGFAPGKLSCLCAACRKRFRQTYKCSLTAKNALTHEQRLDKQRLTIVEEFLCNTRAVIDKHKPGLDFTHNHALFFENTTTADAQVDFGAVEVHPHMNVYAPEISAAALRPGGKPFECIPSVFHFGWGEWTNKSTPQLQYECSSIIAGGGNINLGDHMSRTGALTAGTYKKIKTVFDFVKKREQFTSAAEDVPYAAILSLDGSFYWNRPVWGAARLLSDAHVQYNILNHKNLLDELPKYKMLILPYQRGFKPHRDKLYLPPLPKLNKNQYEAIAAWVRKGGVLVFNYDKILAECAGLHYKSLYKSSLGYIEAGEEFAKDYDLPLLIRSPFRRLECTTAKPLLNWRLPYAEPTPQRRFSNSNTPPPGKFAPSPAVTVNQYGKGQVVYFACDIFLAYTDYVHSWVKSLFIDVLNKYAPRKPFTVQAPSTVHVRLTRNGNERYLHLLQAHVQPRAIVFSKAGVYPVEIIEEVVPVSEVVLTVPDCEVRTAILEPSGEKLRLEKKRGETRIYIPQVAVYDVVRLT